AEGVGARGAGGVAGALLRLLPLHLFWVECDDVCVMACVGDAKPFLRGMGDHRGGGNAGGQQGEERLGDGILDLLLRVEGVAVPDFLVKEAEVHVWHLGVLMGEMLAPRGVTIAAARYIGQQIADVSGEPAVFPLVTSHAPGVGGSGTWYDGYR